MAWNLFSLVRAAIEILQQVPMALHVKRYRRSMCCKCKSSTALCTSPISRTQQCHPSSLKLVTILLWTDVLERLIEDASLKAADTRRCMTVHVGLMGPPPKPFNILEPLVEEAFEANARRRWVVLYLDFEFAFLMVTFKCDTPTTNNTKVQPSCFKHDSVIDWTSPSPAARVSVQTGFCGASVASTANPENSCGSVAGLTEVATMP
eukprot:CAMPEP_0172890292 /NCGR_PEP_ID=MMETSP1075-20121228/140846_1 /TAXON_ID=2916 /ORGANISM="Ceratium fusus, Strain PA161109" /LENGTH=205 /DNA_ID=CAMNT_0013744517 /DNA_START=136 /DNA_END=754 /DNA_ORIENTATION=-